ncbi:MULTISPECIES: class F sortase [unclassified Pseudonocardia]|uniref:class F sortase n=1 Tax=unclassified Pseudonocardia TaxID=2619320 RepID=UPI0011AE72E3|nr:MULTISPECIES: class F sortase [unclassified Pseudonocardia]
MRRPGALVLPGVVVLVVLLLTGCAGAGVDGPAAPERPAGPITQAPVVAAPGEVVPTSVRIPAIGLDEPSLVRLGVTGEGTAEVPQDYDRVGWFDRGGNPGPAVLMGHVDSRDGPAVFFDLRDLAAGDVIEVGRSDGTTGRYAVEYTRQVPKDEFPTFEVFGAAPEDVLRLVTCAGEFDRGERSYLDNLVVHARAA